MHRRRLCLFGFPLLFLVIILLAAPAIVSLKDTYAFMIPTTIPNSSLTSLKVVTMTFSQTKEHKYIEHNCMRISRTRHHFVVFTDDLSQSYCAKCECRLFTRENREMCTQKKTDWNPGWCEKLYFFVRLLDYFDEFVLLDSDLLILKDEFLDRLSARARVHDFLATYGHMSIVKIPQSYRASFNSGLLFMRRLPGLDYKEIKTMWKESKTPNDQNIISHFVQKRYENWDTLSWKWHCRGLKKYNQNIPLSHCYTIHDRGDAERVLKDLNLTMLRVPSL